MVLIVGLSVLMLFFGAALPMLIDPLPRLIYLWLPSTFYLFIAVLGIWRLGGRQLGSMGITAKAGLRRRARTEGAEIAG
jgi:hypothetical protein